MSARKTNPRKSKQESVENLFKSTNKKLSKDAIKEIIPVKALTSFKIPKKPKDKVEGLPPVSSDDDTPLSQLSGTKTQRKGETAQKSASNFSSQKIGIGDSKDESDVMSTSDSKRSKKPSSQTNVSDSQSSIKSSELKKQTNNKGDENETSLKRKKTEISIKNKPVPERTSSRSSRAAKTSSVSDQDPQQENGNGTELTEELQEEKQTQRRQSRRAKTSEELEKSVDKPPTRSERKTRGQKTPTPGKSDQDKNGESEESKRTELERPKRRSLKSSKTDSISDEDVSAQPIKKSGKSGIKKAKKEKEELNQTLQCLHCQFTVDVFHKMKFHYARVHTLLYSKTTPEGTDDIKSLKQIASLLGGKLTCFNCKKEIKTVGYYRQHVQWCLSDKKEKEQCSLCGKEYVVFWKQQHMVVCKKRQEAKQELKLQQKNAEQPREGSRKRRAATKARQVIKGFTEDKEEINWQDMYSTPLMTVPSQETLDMWNKCAEEGNMILCAHKGCEVQRKKIEEITEHYWTCPNNGLDVHTWGCRKCSKRFHSEKDVLKHVKSHEKKKKGQKVDDEYNSADNDDISSEGLTDGDDDDDLEDSDNLQDDTEPKQRRVRNKDNTFRGSHYSNDGVPSKFSGSTLCTSLHADLNTRIPDFLPTVENLKSEDVDSEIITSSPSFTLNTSKDIHQLEVGESLNHKNAYIQYLGKPIKLLSWCPFPKSSIHCLERKEYFAVVFDSEKVNFSKTYTAPGNISIWWIQDLKTGMTKVNMDMLVNLKHNFGNVNQIRWCYDGGFIPPNQDSKLGRLGLLALACSDGCVHIASVPFIADNTSQPGKTNSYYLEDSLTLSVRGNTAQCTSVDWQRKDIKFIVAGFSDGSVAIWYVGKGVRSPTLQPIKVFRSHTSLITSVKWCPFHPDLFSTFSHGWFIWDMKDLSSPYFTPKASDWCMDLHTKAIWPALYHVIICCTDPSFGTPSLNLISLGYEMIVANQKTPIREMQHTSDVDLCDCSDIIVVSDFSGTVGWHNPIVPKYCKSGDRIFFNLTALRTSSSEVQGSGTVWNFQYMLKKAMKGGSSKANQCDTDVLMTNNREAAINSISMNPNAKGHGWLLCGGTQGFIHLIKLGT